MKKCLKCGAEVSSTAKFCGECGAKIEHKNYCPECGTEVKPEHRFCMECGTRLSETPSPQPKVESKPSKAVTKEDEKKSEPKSAKKSESKSAKKSEPKLDKETSKELTNLYNKAVAYQIGKNGAEKDIMFALECYYEYLEKAPASHSKYLDVHYGIARICTEMGDGCHNLDMDDEALDWYNDAVEHYEVILVKYPKKPLNERILAQWGYDKVREKIAKLK